MARETAGDREREVLGRIASSRLTVLSVPAFGFERDANPVLLY
jgi:hypothetical protein